MRASPASIRCARRSIRAPPIRTAASKAAAEAMLLAEARSYGLDVVIARAFNHIGPGQSDRFVVASFAAQLARIAGGAPPQMLRRQPRRPVAIFSTCATSSRPIWRSRAAAKAREVYNVCSGRAVTIRDVLRELIAIARVPVEVREDPQRMRPADVPFSVGSPREAARRRPAGSRAIRSSRSLRDIYARHARSPRRQAHE